MHFKFKKNLATLDCATMNTDDRNDNAGNISPIEASIDISVAQLRPILESARDEQEIMTHMISMIDFVLSERMGLTATRTFISGFLDIVKEMSESLAVPLVTHVLESLEGRVISLEDQAKFCCSLSFHFHLQVVAIKLFLADTAAKKQEWRKAADYLASIPWENRSEDIEGAFAYLRIAAYYIEAADFQEAETYVHRSSQIFKCENCDIEARKKMLCARILQGRQKFNDAAKRFYEVSLCILLPVEERTQMIRSAVLCAILSPVNQLRSRLLSALYKDSRTKQFPLFPILEKMFFENILPLDLAAEVEKELPVHQLQPTKDGFTVAQSAFIEHGLMSASKFYKNITLKDMGNLLHVSEETAEKFAARMIFQNRLDAQIDGIKKILMFKTRSGLEFLNEHIRYACESLNSINDDIAAAYPEWYEKIFESYKE
ncbi:COP9 signalosome complex subunit 4 [Trichinella pseudospiralis]|uniref:COP9 signalosome complex subunit 4 n=2 Tax=Trichinella pseudospiralis TaxID=6337 RepID=A0A0V1DWK0_TRIPS|nr:COP9 signalosome complex subunit 4 [Trichinella pseudospiralis]KRZ26749.1 COP9 signalosome complex subunit 4 [Trichinella pseudospiralis]